MKVLCLLLLLPGLNALVQDARGRNGCVVKTDKEDLLQLTVMTATKVIIKHVNKFNGGAALETQWVADISDLVMKELLDGATFTKVIEKLIVWCVVNKPTDRPPTEITTIDEDKETEVDDADKSEGETVEHFEGNYSKMRSYLCMMEDNEEKCYAYTYSPDAEISVEEYLSHIHGKPREVGQPISQRSKKAKPSGNKNSKKKKIVINLG